MPIKQYKPTSPGRRGASVVSNEELTRKEPERRLLRPLRRSGGRNNTGRVTTRHRGGGAKRSYRLIDFKRNKIGVPGNVDHQNVSLGKAGRKRHLGRRPEVRGTAMNPRDHPHGGGEGKSPIGLPGPKTPWGKPALGYKTRKNKRTEQFIVKRRGQK